MASALIVCRNTPLADELTTRLRQRGHKPVVARSTLYAVGMTARYDVGIFDLDLEDGINADIARLLLAQRKIGTAVFVRESRSSNPLPCRLVGPVFDRTDLDALLAAVECGVPPTPPGSQ
jgi:hypothetical protein